MNYLVCVIDVGISYEVVFYFIVSGQQVIQQDCVVKVV